MPTSVQRQAHNARRRELRHLREDAIRRQQTTNEPTSEPTISLPRRGRPPRQISTEDRRATRTTRLRKRRQLQHNNISLARGPPAPPNLPTPPTHSTTAPTTTPPHPDTNDPPQPTRRMGRRPTSTSTEESRALRNARQRNQSQLQRNNNARTQEMNYEVESEEIQHGFDNISDEEMNSESESEELLLSEPSKNAVNNKEGLLEKLEDIAWPNNLEWIQKLTVVYDQAEGIDVNDDLSRELAFYNQALNSARQAFEKLQSMGNPFLRPPDFYAEMVKSDTHMLKIKSRLLSEKKKIDEAEERKKARESKKLAKEVQSQKLKERAKHKKEEIESVKKWRKQRQQSGFAKGKDEEIDFGHGGSSFQRSKKKRPGVSPSDRAGGFKAKDASKKRAFRERKFGHGGHKGLKKLNTAETTNDLRDFNKGGASQDRKKRKR